MSEALQNNVNNFLSSRGLATNRSKMTQNTLVYSLLEVLGDETQERDLHEGKATGNVSFAERALLPSFVSNRYLS